MTELALSAGTIDYVDTGGDGPVVVALHGFLMDPTLWDAVIADLRVDHRCIAPALPLGGHRRPMHDDADLSLPGLTRLVAEFLERLDLQEVTLVGNDTGGALAQLVVADAPQRVGRAVLVSCEAFDNLPPGLTGRMLALSGTLSPRLFGAFMQQLRLRAIRRMPIAFGRLTKRGDATTVGWLQPVLTQPAIRRDAVRAIRAVMGERRVLLDVAERLPTFTRPVLVVWAREDRVMPPEHGRRLAELFPDARLVEVEDSYTLVALDQPSVLAEQIRQFTHVAATAHGST